MSQDTIAAATGRRKTAVARVSLVSGEGKCTINRRAAEEYVTDEASRIYMLQPLKIAGVENKYDVVAFAKGGGITGQAGAVRHGLASDPFAERGCKGTKNNSKYKIKN